MSVNRYKFPNQTQPRPGFLDMPNPNTMIPGIDFRCLPAAIRAQNELLCPSNPNLNNLQVKIKIMLLEKFNDYRDVYERLTITWETNTKTCLNKNFTDNDYLEVVDEQLGLSYKYLLSRAKTYHYMDVDSGRRFYRTVFKGMTFGNNSIIVKMYINGQPVTDSLNLDALNRIVSTETLRKVMSSNDDIFSDYMYLL